MVVSLKSDNLKMTVDSTCSDGNVWVFWHDTNNCPQNAWYHFSMLRSEEQDKRMGFSRPDL
jgi:uncharacterized protein YodC (DUF2158 family)